MKNFFDALHNFNSRLAHFAKQEVFTSTGLVSLSVASWITTFYGMLAYTDMWLIAFLGSSGMQILMLYGAVKFSDTQDKSDSKAFFLLTTYFAAMGVSTFFSFAAFHQVIETPQRRVEEADTLLRSDWSRVFNKIDAQAMGEFDYLLKQNNGGSEFSRWSESVAVLKAGVGVFFGEAQARLDEERQALLTRPEVSRALSLDGQISEKRKEREQVQKIFSTAQSKADQVSAKAQEKRELYELERDQGGTAQNQNGRRTRAGVGDIARGHLRDYQELQAQARLAELEANGKRNQLSGVDVDIEALLRDRSALAGVGPAMVRVSEIESALQRLNELKGRSDRLMVPTGLTGGSSQALVGLKDVLSTTTRECTDIKGQTGAMLAVFAERQLEGKLAASYDGVRNSSCDAPPTLSGNRSIPAQIDAIALFNTDCRSEKTPPFNRERALKENQRNAGGAPPRSFREGAVIANGEYAMRFHELQEHYLQCLDKAPQIKSGRARDMIIDDFRDLIQKYNPEAHPFTRALAAFQRGDQTAYFALMVAFTMDILIFFTGMASQRSFYDGDNIALQADTHRQQKKREFFSRHSELVDKILKLTASAGRSMVTLNDRLIEAYSVPKNWGELLPHLEALSEMHNLGILTIDNDRIVISVSQVDEIRQCVAS